MVRTVVVKVLPSCDDLPPPRDWLLASLTAVQLEGAVIRAALAPHSDRFGDDIVKFVPAEYSTRDAEYVQRFSPAFQHILPYNRLYVAVLTSPLAHLPDYGEFCNRALSAHLWLGQTFEPTGFQEKLRLGLIKFLASPDSLIYPPAEGRSEGPEGRYEGSEGRYEGREGHVPVRLFIMKIDDAYETDVGSGEPNRSSPPEILMRDLQRLFSRLPPFRYTYTASVYLLEKPELDCTIARCIGYCKRVVPATPSFRNRQAVGF